MQDRRTTDPRDPTGGGTDKEWMERLTRRSDLPLETEVLETADRGPVSVMDITFAGITGERVPAYRVIPKGRDRFGIVLFVHPGPGDRSRFYQEALRLGSKGIGSFLVEAPWAAGEAWAQTLGAPEKNREVFVDAIRGLSRALDVAIDHPGVDPSCIACVGQSMGALCVAVLAGIDPRCCACVLVVGAPSFADVALANLPSLAGDELEHYREVMAPIDPATHLCHAAPLPRFFQFGERDRVFSRERSEAFAAAASEPKFVRWYYTDHAFESEEAERDRVEWLLARLGTGYRRMKGTTGRPPVRRK
ncbi:hypothetical protein DSECCO2_271800 [anaerobic digester metagenome]